MPAFYTSPQKNLAIGAEFPQEGTWWRMWGPHRLAGALVRFWRPRELGGEWGGSRMGATYPEGVAVSWHGLLGRYDPGTPPLGETPPVAPVPEGQKTMTVNREENQFSERTGDLALLPRTHRESAQSEGRPPRAR